MHDDDVGRQTAAETCYLKIPTAFVPVKGGGGGALTPARPLASCLSSKRLISPDPLLIPGGSGGQRGRGGGGGGSEAAGYNRESTGAFRIDVLKRAFVCIVLPGVPPFRALMISDRPLIEAL